MQQLKSHNGRLLIYAILLLAVIAIMFLLKTCSYKNYYVSEQLPSGGDTIDVAIEYSPLSLYTYDDTLGGFNHDLMKFISQQQNIRIKFHPIVSLTDALKKLSEGKYDILIAELPMTSKYTDKFLFTDAVYLDRQVLVQLKDSMTQELRIKTQLDLAGDTVWVVANSPLSHRISNLAREIGDTIYVMEDSTYAAEQLFLLTATGDIKQAVVNERVAKSLAHNYPLIDISTNISFTQFQSWLVNINDSTLCDSLNSWIGKAKLTPFYKHIEKRYLK